MFRCRVHGEEFKAGKSCSACKPGDFKVEADKTAAELEGSKAFAKEIRKRGASIPEGAVAAKARLEELEQRLANAKAALA